MAKKKNQLKPIDTPVYGYLSAMYKSFYSARLYVDVGKRWRGLGLLYLLFTIAIFTVPSYLRMSTNFKNSFVQQIETPLLNTPSFYIQNGEVIFDKPMPYFVKNNQGQVSVIIDTTGKINDFSKDYPNLTVLINKNKMSLQLPRPQFLSVNQDAAEKDEPVVQTFNKNMNYVFDGKKLVEQKPIQNLIFATRLIIYPMTVALFSSMLLVFFLVLSLLGQLFSNIFFAFKITYLQANRLLMVSGTPMLFVFFFLFSVDRIFLGVNYILFALLIVYYSFALYCLRAESRRVALS